MLENENRKKIEDYIENLITGLKVSARKYYNSGLTDKQIIEKITSITVNKLTVESKMILSSTYNMLLEQTMKKPEYSDAERKAAFYRLDILGNINKKFTFEVPNQINYEESRNEVNKWIIGGACAAVAAGGGVSLRFKSLIPIGIAVGAVVIAGIIIAIMSYILGDNQDKGSSDIRSVINQYYAEVQKALLSWVRSIEDYYDKCVADIEME